MVIIHVGISAYAIISIVQPFSAKGDLRNEIINETVIMIITYTVICFSPWIQDLVL